MMDATENFACGPREGNSLFVVTKASGGLGSSLPFATNLLSLPRALVSPYVSWDQSLSNMISFLPEFL